ncbi:unnamed protein product, partial [Musa acuminata subsp. burmannicoides]
TQGERSKKTEKEAKRRGGTDSPGSLPECGQPSGPLLPQQGGGGGGKGTKMMVIQATTMCYCNKTPNSLVLLILLVNMN